MFGFGGKEKVIDKARRLVISGKPEKALEVLQSALTGDDSDLPLILEIMHVYSSMGHFKEVIIWAKKGEGISRDTKEHIIKEVEDLYYGSNKPRELAEYLVEKRTEARDFEGVWEIVEGTDREHLAEIIQKENAILSNIREKEKLSPRDRMHFYMTGLCYEPLDTRKSMEIFMELLQKAPEEEDTIYNEIERINRNLFGDPYIMIALGRLLIRRGNLERGIEQFKKATERSPQITPYAIEVLEEFSEKVPETLDLLSDLYIKTGDKEKALQVLNKFRGKAAIKKYEELVRTNPNSVEALQKLAYAYLDEKRYEDTLKTLKKVFELNPDALNVQEVVGIVERVTDNPDAIFIASEILRKMGKPKLAVEALKKAFAISPSSVDDILGSLKDVLSEYPDLVEAVVFKGELLAFKKEFDEAIETIETVLDYPEGIELAKEVLLKIYKNNPENSKSAILVNIINLKTNPERSIENLNRILSEEPGAIPYLMKQLDTWIRIKPDYIPYVLKAYESFPPDAFPPFVLPFAIAEAYALNGDFENARQFYIKAVKQDPNRAGFIIKAIRNHPESQENFLLLIELLILFRMFKKAEEVIQTSIKKFPDITRELVTVLLTSVERVGRSPGIYSILLNLLNEHGYYEEVIKYGERAEDILPRGKRGDLYFNLANAYGKTGREQEFVKYLALAVAEDRNLVKKAIGLIESFMKEQEVSSETYLLLHSLYRDEREISKAADALYMAYEKNPGIGDAIIEDFKKLIDIAPIEASLYHRLGQIMLSRGDGSALELLQKAARFDPTLREAVIESLKSAEGTPLESNAILLRIDFLKQEGKLNEVMNALIQVYEGFPEMRQKVVTEIMGLLQKIEVTPENYRDILKIILEERRNRVIVEFVEKLVKNYPGVAKDIIALLDEYFGEEYPTPLRLLKAKLLKISGKKEEVVRELRVVYEKAPDSAGTILELLDVDSPESARLYIDCNIQIGNYDEAFKGLSLLGNDDRVAYLQELIRYSDRVEYRKELVKIYAVMGHWDRVLEIGESIVEQDERDRALLYLAGKDIHVDYNVLQEVKEEILKERIKDAESPEEKYKYALKLGDEELISGVLKELPEEKRVREAARFEIKNGRYLVALKLLNGLEKDAVVLKMMEVCASRLGMKRLLREIRTSLTQSGEVAFFKEDRYKGGWKMIQPLPGR